MVVTLELSRDMFGVRAIPHASLTLSCAHGDQRPPADRPIAQINTLSVPPSARQLNGGLNEERRLDERTRRPSGSGFLVCHSLFHRKDAPVPSFHLSSATK